MQRKRALHIWWAGVNNKKGASVWVCSRCLLLAQWLTLYSLDEGHNVLSWWLSWERWLSWESTCQGRRLRRRGFSPWVGKIPRRRKWQLTPVFLPEKFHGQKSLVGCSPGGHKELDRSEHPCTGNVMLPQGNMLDEDSHPSGLSVLSW